MLFALPLALSGCAGRAYSDLYIENMAGEIRDLEDQLYEYDHQYRVLEQENADLQRANDLLRQQTTLEQQPNSSGSGFRGFLDEDPIPADPALPEDFNAGPSILEQGGIDQGTPGQGNPGTLGQEDTRIPGQAPPGSPRPLERGSNAGGNSGNAPERGEANPFPGAGVLPTPPSMGGAPPANSTPGVLPDGYPNSTNLDSGFDLDPELLSPPTIELGEPIPPALPVMSGAANQSRIPGQQTDSLSPELAMTKIKVPARLASQSNRQSSQAGQVEYGSHNSAANKVGSSTNNLATITAAVPQVTDQRIVEIAFHPGLSHAANFDDEPDDDGLYLVLQPMNSLGQVVTIPAKLSVAVIDSSRDGPAARIGRWDYSPQEVKKKIEPIGSQQGIHLRLPWNGPDPGADRVEVFVRYTFADGRQIVGSKTIFVSTNTNFRSVWAPRGANSSLSHDASRVATASYDANGNYDANGKRPTNLVRPPLGTTVAEPAPIPQGIVTPLRSAGQNVNGYRSH